MVQSLHAAYKNVIKILTRQVTASKQKRAECGFAAPRCGWHKKCARPVDAGNPITNGTLLMNAVVSPRPADAGRAQPDVQTLRRTFVVNLEHGLHARPCAVLVKTLQPYDLTVDVELNGEIASGKSILGLMALAAGYGSKVTFAMTGHDAFEAMARVERIFSTNFESAYRA